MVDIKAYQGDDQSSFELRRTYAVHTGTESRSVQIPPYGHGSQGDNLFDNGGNPEFQPITESVCEIEGPSGSVTALYVYVKKTGCLCLYHRTG